MTPDEKVVNCLERFGMCYGKDSDVGRPASQLSHIAGTYAQDHSEEITCSCITCGNEIDL